jgi:hypothetical protein
MPLNKIPRLRDPETRDCVKEVREMFLEEYKRDPSQFYEEDAKLVDEKKFLLLRCLISKRKNVKEAYNMLVNMCKWRKENRLRELTDQDFPVEYFLAGISFVYEPDKFGNRTLYIRTGRIKCIPELKHTFKLFTAYLLYKIDDCENGETFAIIFDLTNTGWNNYDIDLLMYFLTMLKEYFPVNADYILAINFPWILTTAWSVVKRLIPPERRDVVVFIQSKDVFNYVDKQNCPDFLEGDCKRDHQFMPKSDLTLVDYLLSQKNPDLSIKRMTEIVKSLADVIPKERVALMQKRLEDCGGR